MKKLILLLLFLIAYSKPLEIDGIKIYNFPQINEINTTKTIEINNTKLKSLTKTNEINASLKNNETNISLENNETNISLENNKTNIYLENNQTNISLENNETNISKTPEIIPTTYEKIFDSNIKTIKPKIDIAVLINKQKFKKYLPSIINSLNAYFIYKHAEYNLSVYDINQTNQALKHKNIIVYTYNPNNIKKFINYNNNLYFPMINKNETNITKPNFYFGGINYISQIKKLSLLTDMNKTIVINDNTLTSKLVFSIENKFFNTIPFEWNQINYNDLNNSYVFLNTAPQKSIQILSNIYYKNINPILILSTQINYNPMLIALTQPQALTKLILANSIINPPKELVDIDLLLDSDIKFNWLNYSANILCNKIYNTATNSDSYFMNDFLIFIFNNQINYKTQLYQIVFNAFKKISSP